MATDSQSHKDFGSLIQSSITMNRSDESFRVRSTSEELPMYFNRKSTSHYFIGFLFIVIQIVFLVVVCHAQGPTLEQIAHFDEFGQSSHISDDRLYILTNNRLKIFSLADPENPTELGSHPIADCLTVFAQGDYAYVITFWEMKILDVSNPSNIIEVGDYEPTNLKLFVLGDYAYLLLPGNLDIVDVSNPANPVSAGEFALNGSKDIFVEEGSTIAYVIDLDGLHILDVSDPASVVELSVIEAAGRPTCIWVSDSIAFVGSMTGDWPDEQFIIQAFDVSDRENPIELDQTVAEAGYIEDIKAQDGYIFATIGEGSGIYSWAFNFGNFIAGARFTEHGCFELTLMSADECTIYVYTVCYNEGHIHSDNGNSTAESPTGRLPDKSKPG